MDPTLLALLSIFGGVSITVLAGFIGAWIQGRREHAKWLREKRYEAYVTFLAHSDKTTDIAEKIAKALKAKQFDTASRLVDEMELDSKSRPEAVGAVLILGGSGVQDATKLLVRQIVRSPAEVDFAAVRQARSRLVLAMREVLGVDD